MMKLVVSINILTGVWYQVSWEILMLMMKLNIYLLAAHQVIGCHFSKSSLSASYLLSDGLHIMLNSFKYFHTRI